MSIEQHKITPIIFLDIDGVLNNPGIWGKHIPNPGDALDSDMVCRLSNFVEEADCDIVISSSWRYQYDTDAMRALLVSKGLLSGSRVFSSTPKSWKPRHRGEEIAEWLISAFDVPDLFPPYLILDDMGLKEFEGMGEHLVHTNGATGLTARDLDMARRLLNRQGYFYGRVPTV